MEFLLKAKQTRYGMMLFLPEDSYIGRSLDLYGEFSKEEHDFFDFIYRGGAAVDVGANIGAHSVALAATFAHVFAFEPQEVIYRLLVANLAKWHNVTTYNAAVGKSEGLIDFPVIDYTKAGNFGAVSCNNVPNTATVKLQQRRLDGIDALRQEAQIDLIKVDVEGMELDVLDGAQGLIDKHRPVLYVENDQIQKTKALVNFIYNLEYRAYWHCTFLYNPKNFAGNQANVFPATASFNLICLPNDRKYFALTNFHE